MLQDSDFPVIEVRRDARGRFPKGSSGNPRGSAQPAQWRSAKSNRLLATALRMELAQRPQAVAAIINRLLDFCLDDDPEIALMAISLVFERLEGKLSKTITLGRGMPTLARNERQSPSADGAAKIMLD